MSHAATPKQQVDEAYVEEILASLPKGLSELAFQRATQADVNGGYAAEVEEAKRRYFKEAR